MSPTSQQDESPCDPGKPPALPSPVAATPRAGPGSVLDSREGEQVLDMVEASLGVARRHQFYGWTMSYLHSLLPHVCLVCGHWQRSSRQLELDVFHNVVLSEGLLKSLGDSESALMCAVVAAWVEGRGRPLLLELRHFLGGSEATAQTLQAELGPVTLLVHGVARPQRPHEVESLFLLLLSPSSGRGVRNLQLVELCLPYLHTVWQRVMTMEAGLGSVALPMPRVSAAQERATPGGQITAREQQILAWVRDGKSNQQIATLLGISGFTVKNHLQKIMRKLGACNRTQAAALAIQRGVLDPVRR